MKKDIEKSWEKVQDKIQDDVEDGFEDLSNIPVQIIIVDVESNTIVMQSTIQE